LKFTIYFSFLFFRKIITVIRFQVFLSHCFFQLIAVCGKFTMYYFIASLFAFVFWSRRSVCPNSSSGVFLQSSRLLRYLACITPLYCPLESECKHSGASAPQLAFISRTGCTTALESVVDLAVGASPLAPFHVFVVLWQMSIEANGNPRYSRSESVLAVFYSRAGVIFHSFATCGAYPPHL